MIEKDASDSRQYILNYTFNNRRSKQSIGLYDLAGQIELNYTKGSGLKEETFSYTAPVVWTECNFGGHRPWFKCPAVGCNKRVEKLYKPMNSDYFACRHCYNITYRRCNISGDPISITTYKKQKIAEKLDLECSNLERPKNMHKNTFRELREEWKDWDDLHHMLLRRNSMNDALVILN